jgi:hypothetical protein
LSPTDDTLSAAHLGADMPGVEFVIAGDRPSMPADSGRTILAVRDATEEGSELPRALSGLFPADSSVDAVSEPYLHSKKSPPLILGTAFMPGH